MKSYVAIPASLALIFSLSACDRASAPADGNAATVVESSAADAEAVKKDFAAFNAAIAARDLDAIKTHYASGAVMVLPGYAPFEGVDAIMADYKAFAADAAGKYASGAETTVVSPKGDMAYGEVRYQTTFTNSKTKAVETDDRYNLSLYQKQSDGSWKIIRDVNVSLPKAS